MTAGDRPDLTEGDAGERSRRGPDVLSSSEDEPLAEERMRLAFAHSGVSAWVRRHRRLVGGLSAVLVVVATGAWYLVTRPPPAGPVRVTIVGMQSAAPLNRDAQHRTRVEQTYQLTAHGAGDVDATVGIVGPGLTNPTSSISTVKFGLPRVGTLGATVDCTDSTWWSAKDGDYRARVRRTDTYGRVTTYDAPLGKSGTVWHVGVRSTCLRTLVKKIPPGVASAVSRPHEVEVTLTLTNPTRRALWVEATGFGNEIVTTTGGALTPLPAGGTATVKMSIRAIDCASGVPHLPLAKDVEGIASQDVALPVYLTDTEVPTYHQIVVAWPRVDAASTALVNRQLATLCPRAR